MIVFINSLKRLLKSRVQVAVLLILPFIPIIPIALDPSGSMSTFNIGIVNNDTGKLTDILTKTLQANFNVTEINEKDIENELNSSKIDYAIVIPKGFTDDIINLKDIKLKGYEKKGKDCALFIGGSVDSFLYPVKNIARASGGDSSLFYKNIEKVPVININKSAKKNNAVTWGMIIQFVMFSSIFTSTLILEDKENKTFFRSLNAPLSLKSYMLQTILSFIVLSIIQITVLSSVVVFGFGIYGGTSLWNMMLLLAVIALVSVSFGVAVSALGKNTTQATMIGIGLVTLMCMLGGAWGIQPSSEIISSIAKALPVTWAMDAVEKLLNNKSSNSIIQNIEVLLAFSAVFFLLGTWKKADIVE